MRRYRPLGRRGRSGTAVHASRRTAVLAAVVAAVAAGCGSAGTPAGPVPAGTATTATTSAPSPAPSTGTGTAPRTGTTTTWSAPPSTTRPTGSAPSRRTTSASAALPAGLAGVDLEVLPTSAKQVALTFDAGADDAALDPVLATLARTGTPATFFLTGDFVDEFPSGARRIAAAGHTIGNHTQDHRDLTTLGDTAVRRQLTAAQARIVAVTGVDPRPWFRFPFGESDPRTVADANALGYACIRWTVDTLGWQGTSGGRSVASVRDRVLGAARPGEIVLMHVGANPDDGSTLDADALPQVISGLRARGYTFVALDPLLR